METAMPAVRAKFVALVSRLGGSAAAARAIGCTRAYVDMITKGDRRPGIMTAWAIERASDGEIRMQEWCSDEKAAPSSVQP